jgi:hypothetical protein
MANRTCSVPECDKPIKARGWCNPHYEQWRAEHAPRCVIEGCDGPGTTRKMCTKHYQRAQRDADLVAPTRDELTDEQRHWAKVDVGHPLGCWEWTGGLNAGGYGRSWHDGDHAMAHRYSYELLVGPIGDDLTLDHLCRNRRCVNPDHLEPVDMRENIFRGYGVARINAEKDACPQGHPYDDQNTYRHPRGNRVCVECRREAKRRRAA